MNINVLPVMSIISSLSIFVLMIVMGLLSKRLGSVTRTAPFYVGFYVAAVLFGLHLLLQLVSSNQDVILQDVVLQTEANPEIAYFLSYVGLPALALTIAVLVAWRYWSWLLAERS